MRIRPQQQPGGAELLTGPFGRSGDRNKEKSGVLGRVAPKTHLGLPTPHPFKVRLRPKSEELLVPKWFT